jgi:hypothetical protein
VLLWTDDVDISAIIHCFADKWNVLETKNCQVLLMNPAPQNVLSLKVKRALAENGSNESSSFEVGLDLREDLVFGVCRRADDDNVSILHDILSIA